MKTVEKRGLQVMAKEAGIDLYGLPYVDARPERQEWLAQQPRHPPMVSPRLRTVLYVIGAVSRFFCAPEKEALLSVCFLRLQDIPEMPWNALLIVVNCRQPFLLPFGALMSIFEIL